MTIPSLASVSKYTTERYNAIEVTRDGKLTKDDKEWNLCHGPRNYYVLDSILKYIEKKRLKSLVVLNMSGMNEGKPDPVLYDLLAMNYAKDAISWNVIDHPQSLTFTDPVIQSMVKERGIVCIPHDHRDEEGKSEFPAADVVLCTEIVEHLDYSDTIKLLKSCWDALKPGGLLIVTTPNAVYLGHRVLFALGYWDFLHHMDEPAHVEHGLVGHTIYYDVTRLSRLLRNLNFSNVDATTFNAGHGPGEYRNVLTRFAAITLRALSNVVPHSAQVLHVIAERPQ